jgi:hypothetical protein
MIEPSEGSLQAVAAEVEAHVAHAGWDRGTALFALVRAAQFVIDEPEAAARLEVDARLGDRLMPIEQESPPDAPIDEMLARISWPASGAGCALAQEILILPPSAQDELETVPDDAAAISLAAGHPERREARLVVAVLRDGSSAALLRLRDTPDGLLAGADLAPNLVRALVATLHED